MPSADTLFKMADFFNVSTDYLLDRTDIQTPIKNLSIDGLNVTEIELITLFKNLTKIKQNKIIGYVLGLSENDYINT